MLTKSQKLKLVLLNWHYNRVKKTLATEGEMKVLKDLKKKVYGLDKKLRLPSVHENGSG